VVSKDRAWRVLLLFAVRTAAGTRWCVRKLDALVWVTLGSHHLLGRYFVEVDLPDWVRDGRVLWAWTARLAVLAVLCLLKRDLSTVWVTVDVDVCLAHGDGWLVG
jgi:hypothetical protein